MQTKTVPLSVRVSDDDATFLAGTEIAGATTPSEKLRAMLAAERRRREGAEDPAEAVEMFADMLRPAQRRVRGLAEEADLSSEAIAKLYERLPELLGVAYSGPRRAKGEAAEIVLKRFEGRLLDQAFALLEDVLALGMLSEARCYDPDAISKRLGPVLELVELIRLSRERRDGGNKGEA
ncbi:MAG: hypothetical protein AAFR11_10455 [Pseudomonadota bacterium]